MNIVQSDSKAINVKLAGIKINIQPGIIFKIQDFTYMDPSTSPPPLKEPERNLYKKWEYQSYPQHMNCYLVDVILCFMAEGTPQIMAT